MMYPTVASYLEAVPILVGTGAAYLDRHVGTDWINRVNPRTLRMASGEACVLGQLFGHYRTGLSRLFTRDDTHLTPSRYGFMLPSIEVLPHDVEEYTTSIHRMWTALDRAWAHLILSRLAGDALRASRETPMRVPRALTHA